MSGSQINTPPAPASVIDLFIGAYKMPQAISFKPQVIIKNGLQLKACSLVLLLFLRCFLFTGNSFPFSFTGTAVGTCTLATNG